MEKDFFEVFPNLKVKKELEELLGGCDILVDAVYGIGMRGQLPDAVRQTILAQL